jgi:hypothetical protein
MTGSLGQIAQERAFSRRDFLRSAAAAGASQTLLSFSPLKAAALARNQKVVVVTFGGGARDEETFAIEGQKNIPCMMSTLIPQATFCTQVVNRGILGHYVATASLATGVYESFDNFATVAPANATVFEHYRKGLSRPATDAWVIAPSNGFNRIGQSDGSRIARGYGAQVILPKHLLTAALGSTTADNAGMKLLLQDNYENPLVTPSLINSDVQLAHLSDSLHLSVDDFVHHAKSLSSADELSVYVMRQLMRQYAPSMLWITLHEMDIAHTGAYSLYLDAIQNTDRLCGEIWKAIQSDAEYKDKTTMLILPDFGRDSDFSPSGNGFQHHRTGDALSRTTWMMALGPHVRQGITVDRPLESLDLVPTLGALLRFETPGAQGKAIVEVL